jgi:hypothetical protein
MAREFARHTNTPGNYQTNIFDRVAAFILDYLGVKTEISHHAESSSMPDKQLNKAVLHRDIESLAIKKHREAETFKLRKLLDELNTL